VRAERPGPKVEIDTKEKLDAMLKGPWAAGGAVFQGLDLRDVGPALSSRDLTGAVFAGCHLPPGLAARAAADGALVFPRVEGQLFDPWRTRLYSPEELYAGFDPERAGSEAETLDARIYDSCMDPTTRRPRPAGLDDALFRRLHDFAIADAVGDLLEAGADRGRVAIMGGHAEPRGSDLYRDVARLARDLTREGYLLLSGGGPGLMEATNLGAHFGPHPDEALEHATRRLARAPDYSHPRWLAEALAVRAEWPGDPVRGRSLGIPTWFYGHEPPNPFASHIAKYFENSVREEGLLALATHGVVFAPGNAGTMQEIFQDACQNYYRTHTAFASPMILFGRDYWDPEAMSDSPDDRRKKVWPLLRKLALEKGFADRVSLVDSVGQIAETIRAFRPPDSPAGGGH